MSAKDLNAQVYMLERQNDLLRQLITVMNTTTRLDNILAYILDLITMSTTAESAFLVTKENLEGDFLEVRAVSNLDKKKLTGKEWPVGKGIVGEVYCTGKERTVNAPSQDAAFTSEISAFLGKDVKTLIAYPLNSDGRMVGAIEVINKKDGMKFNEDDMSFVQILADQAAAIVGQAATFKSTEAKIKRFNLLIDVSKDIAQINDLHKLLQKIMESAKLVMRAEASSLFLLDEQANELYIESAQGESGEVIKTLRLPVGKGIAGWVAQKGKPDLIPDAYADNRFNPEFDKKTGFRTKSIVCVPLEYKQKTKGVIQIINSLDKERFDEEDMEYMVALAGQAAVAIENARLLRSNKQMFLEVVSALVRMVDSRYAYFNGHSVRVAKYAMAIGRNMGLPGDVIEKLQIVGFLHDIGRMQMPEAILLKAGPLAPQEMEIIKKQPLIGAKLLQGITMIDYALPAILYHMEHFNGRGYPKGASGEQIPILSRILSVANVYDAFTSPRPHRQAVDVNNAKNKINSGAGAQFDPNVVKAFVKAFDAGQLAK